jgi:hypothetical protein
MGCDGGNGGQWGEDCVCGLLAYGVGELCRSGRGTAAGRASGAILMATARRSITQIFLAPAIISAVIAFGLVSALLGDGIWDQASWLALAVPLGVIVFHVCRRGKG